MTTPYTLPTPRAVGVDSAFETRLIPLPWNGPIVTSRIFVAMLNPSLDPDDIGYESRNDLFCDHLRQNVKGRSAYAYLEEQFQDRPGAAWARKIFGSDHATISAADVCMIQLVPYHCADGKIAQRIAGHLPTTAAMKAWVQQS